MIGVSGIVTWMDDLDWIDVRVVVKEEPGVRELGEWKCLNASNNGTDSSLLFHGKP